MSPALQVSDTAYAGTYAEQIAKQNVPLRLFVTHGGLEPPIDRGTQRFIARFDSLPHASVIMQHRRYADATHGLTPLASFVDGLRFVFEPVSIAPLLGVAPPPNADSAWVIREVAELERRYREGARSLDLPDVLPEVALNQLGYGALQFLKLPGAAVVVFRRNVALYPGSANVYDSLGDGLLAAGDTAGARAAFEKAVEIAKATGHPVLKESEAKLAKLKAAH